MTERRSRDDPQRIVLRAICQVRSPKTGIAQLIDDRLVEATTRVCPG